MFNKFVLVFLILVLSSCSSGRDYKKLFSNAMTIESLITSKDYQKILNSWVKYDSDILVRRWGNPSLVEDVDYEYKVFVFNRASGGSVNPKSNAARKSAFGFEKSYARILGLKNYDDYVMPFTSNASVDGLLAYTKSRYSNIVSRRYSENDCETLFLVDSLGKIQEWSYRGFDCF